MSQYKILTTVKQVRKLIRACKQTKRACVDFETNATKIYRDSFYPTILTVTFQPGSSLIIPLAHFESPFKEGGQWLKILKRFGRGVIEDPNITKMAWNWKFDNQIFQKYGIYSRGPVIDGMLAKYVLNEERPHGLKEMVEKYLPEYAGYDSEDGFNKIPWDKKPLEPLAKYGGLDTDLTFRLCTFMEHRLIRANMYTLYRNLIMPASIVLQSVESKGLCFDKELNKELEIRYAKDIEKTYAELLEIPKVKRYIVRARKESIDNYISKIEEEIEDLKILVKKGDDKKASQARRGIKTREDKILRVMAGQFQTKAEKQLNDDFNFGSTKKLNDLFFLSPHGLKYPVVLYTKDKKTKKFTTTPSTSEDALLLLLEHDKYGVVNKLLELRGLEHTMSGFIKGYQELIQDDGRIHPKFNIHGTVTGRLSSSEPNAQQIPKKEVNPDIKRQFIVPKGHLFLSYDYSQAELRIMAHLSGDETLLEAFRLGRDPHLSVACKKYGKNYDDIYPIYNDETHPDYREWKIKRKQAKQIVFGCIYGIEAKKLSEQLSDIKSGLIVTPEEAQQFLNEFFQDFPKVKKFMDKQKKFMEKHGYVKTLFGRKRRCPNIYSDNYGQYLEACRASFNAPCQGAASDMALFASILIYWLVRRGELPPIPEVSTVHDSIYQYTLPDFINPWTIYQLYKICKNPNTKKYFNFSINDVEMYMDFSVGRNMIEEYPFAPGYDYTKMLDPNWSKDEYYEYHATVKHIPVGEYPQAFPQYFTKEFIKTFKSKWNRIYNKVKSIG